MKPNLLRHLDGENINRFPVWMMRQAGRYLSSYQDIRKQHGFWEMVSSPELAAKVSLLPLAEFPMDGVIFFSDILTPPYGMGIPIELRESVGPVLDKPLRKSSEFELFKSFNPETHTGFIGEAFKQIRSELPEGVALLGFAGAPWTVSSYMIEGNLKARKFSYVKEWLYRDPKDFFGALEMYGDATADYLIYQGKKGADMVQVFDTWLSEMPREIFLKWYRPQLNRIFDKVKKTGIKLVYFAKQSHHLLADFVDLNIDVLSVDHLTSLSDVDKITKGKFSLQGNLDPIILFSSPEVVRAETKKIVAEARNLSRPAIMNLGHGILPKTPVECVRAFVEEASRPWT